MTLSFWTTITYGSRSPLVFVRKKDPSEYTHKRDRGGLNSEQYLKEILQAYFLPWWKKINGAKRKMWFIQDGLPSHKAEKVTKFLVRNGVTIMPWPPNSPDLNVIENAWTPLKTNVKKRFIQSFSKR